MTSSNHHFAIKIRRRGPALIFAVAIVLIAGLVGIPAPAYAADSYIALSIGYINENPPVTMAGGSGISADEEQARFGSLANCESNGGGGCVIQVVAKNACAAAASNDYGEMTGASNASLQAAETGAKNKLQNQQGARVVISGCSSGGQSPPPPPNDPPPAPKLGPTVSFEPVLGGLVAHITDRSGVTSQCAYATDGFNRTFALAANSTYDLRMVPAIPRFRNWTITITCDNGTSTTVTHYF
jgi:hypothetical protein